LLKFGVTAFLEAGALPHTPAFPYIMIIVQNRQFFHR